MAGGKRVAAPEKRWAEPKKETTNNNTPKPKKEKTGSGKGALIPLAVVAILAAAALAFCFYVNSYDKVFPGVTAAGSVELGGLTREEAVAELREALPGLLEATTVEVTLEGESLGTYTMDDTGFAPQTDAMAESAYNLGRGGNFLQNGFTYLKGLMGSGENIPLTTDQDASALDSIISQLAQQVDRPAVDASYELSREGLFATKHQDGRALDQESLRQQLAQITLGEAVQAECSVKTVPGKSLDLTALASELNAEASPARYDKETGKVVDGTVGVVVDVESAKTVLDAAAEGERIQLPAQINYPEMTAQEMEAVLFKDLLGTTTTNVSGTSTRRGNVKLAGEAVNGTILNSGDIFDYNKVVGERTTARGYGAAATYVNGQTVDTVGGGICQVSSTVYLAALLSNLEITERYNHRFYPGYITLGMDATVSWGGPEFRFKNNTDFPIRIDVTYANSKLTVSFYGTKTDDTYVKMTREVLSTTGYETEYVETDELEYGTQKQKQSGYTGYKVKSYRNVYSGDGKLISSTLEATSDYKSRDEIILVGTKNRPAAPSTPTTPEPTTPPDSGGQTTTPPTEGGTTEGGTTEGGTTEGGTGTEGGSTTDTEPPSWLQPQS